MSNVSAQGQSWNLPNYTGELFLIGANQTPFLNMMGGLSGNKIRTIKGLEFPIAQTWALESASQPAISETTSLTAPTPTSYVRGQDVNTVQIFHESVKISYVKQAVSGWVEVQEIGSTGAGLVDKTQVQPVQNEKDFQINANLKQIANDAEYTFLNGTYQQATAVGTAPKTRGIISACSTNSVDASSADLSKNLINELLKDMADNGAIFQDPVIFCGAFQRQQISQIYGYAPESRTVGGVRIEQIETDFATIGVTWAPRVPAATLLIADMAVCRPVFLPVPGKGVLFYEALSKTGASEDGQIFGMMGLDYGPEEYHGKITSLATS